MRLSEKGLDKLYGLDLEMALGFQVSFETLVFKPEDFQGSVVLTVEEAKKIANDLLVYERLYRGAINNSSTSEQDSLDEFCKSQSQKLFKRIEQAEKDK